ncbi:MAG: DUF488 domain-containing protein [Deltaproteobacteria bacterium]|nr:DUF488 domain-containing protein [Deltaproteobacteria bacterium]
MSLSLFTIGYERRNINTFLEELIQHGISLLIDIREIPLSRKPGFSKSKLKEHLERFNIKYIHAKELGSPKNLRKKLCKDNNYDHFFEEYRAYLKTKIETVRNLYWDAIVHEVSCLMCIENEPSCCHRKIVAEKIKKEIDNFGLIVRHL